MDDPFDADGRISETARAVSDTDNYLATLSQAKKGEAEAQYQMGLWHYEGSNIAVEQDIIKAAEWFVKAAAQGHKEAQDFLEELQYEHDEGKYDGAT